MSKLETPMMRRYWKQIGGTLIEEFPAVKGSATCGPRRLDAVILPNGKHRIAHWSEVDIEGQDIIIVQTKAHRLGMHLMGQTVFSLELMRAFKPKSIRAIALCTATDSVLEPLLEPYPDIEVVVISKMTS
jgi:hypothetical protein